MKIIHFLGNQRNPDSLQPLLDMLKRYTLHPRGENMGLRCFDYDAYDAPFRGRSFCQVEEYFCTERNSRVFVATEPIYPEHPESVNFTGNFLGISFPFSISTDEKDVIALLDAAIAENMATAAYKDAMAEHQKRYPHYFLESVVAPEKPVFDWTTYKLGNDQKTLPA